MRLYCTALVLCFILLTACSKNNNTPAIPNTPTTVVDTKISPAGLNYQDIEIDNTRKLAVYLRENREIWIGNLNPANGNFLSANSAGVETVLTSGAMLRSGVLASTNVSLPNTKLIYIRKSDNKIMWLNENTPSIENEIVGAVAGVSGPRSLPNSNDIVFCNNSGQIVLLNTTTNTTNIITNDGGSKTDAFGWYAPEYGGALLIFAIVDQTSLAIYKNNGGAFWEKIKTITVDPTSTHPYIYSVEPFVANGGTKSYFSLRQQKDKVTPPLQTEASIWVWGLDGSRKRCDNGSIARRLDPEFFYGNNEVFLLYNIVVPSSGTNIWEAWSCGTGIKP